MGSKPSRMMRDVPGLMLYTPNLGIAVPFSGVFPTRPAFSVIGVPILLSCLVNS